MSRSRYHRARIAGATTLDREQWGSIVARAEAIERLRWPSFALEPESAPVPERPRSEYVHLGPGQMVIDARMVLNIEAEFALAEEIQDEVRRVAADDMCESRRARLLRTIDEFRERIARRGEPS